MSLGLYRKRLFFPADGEEGELQLENLVAGFIFFGDEGDLFAEGIDALYDALVALLAYAEGEP